MSLRLLVSMDLSLLPGRLPDRCQKSCAQAATTCGLTLVEIRIEHSCEAPLARTNIRILGDLTAAVCVAR
jgi:hypothetical protein